MWGRIRRVGKERRERRDVHVDSCRRRRRRRRRRRCCSHCCCHCHSLWQCDVRRKGFVGRGRRQGVLRDDEAPRGRDERRRVVVRRRHRLLERHCSRVIVDHWRIVAAAAIIPRTQRRLVVAHIRTNPDTNE